MKTIIRIALLLAFAMPLASCSDFLDQPVQGQNVDSPGYYNNIDNANMAVIAAYNGLVYESKLSTFQWAYGNVMTDDAEKGGEKTADKDEIQFLKEWNALSTNNYLVNTWTGYFVAIHRANVVTKRLPEVTFDPKLKKQYIAEAKFIRAYAYFTLTKLFGDLPLTTEPVPVERIGSLGRSPFEEVLKQINTDLEEAAADLPVSYPSEQVGRITSGAANALLARVIMYEIGIFKTKTAADWQKVYNLTSTVIGSGQYNLLANYAQIFEAEGENSSESVFEIQYATTNTGYNFDNSGNPSTVYVSNRGTTEYPEWGWGFNCPTKSLVNEFETNDPRLYCTVHGQGITEHLYGVYQVVSTASHLTGYHARKLAIDPALRGLNTSDSPFNERIIRYSDVLLMNAEACYELKKYDEACTMVNKVRARARNSTYPKGYEAGTNTYKPTDFSDNLKDISLKDAALLTAVKHERRVELAMEYLRYWDLLRWGDYRAKLSPEVQARFDKRQLRGVPVIPIPNEEVLSWGLVQNPN